MGNKRYIEENEKMFGKKIKQLDHIIKDHDYLPTGNEYRGFIIDMHLALIGGRKITTKMESAINNIIKRYKEHLKKIKDPNFLKGKEELLGKIMLVKNMLDRAPYNSVFKKEKSYFLDSVYKQAKQRGTLSPKQKLTLNKMYKQYKKKVEKNT